MSCNDDQVIIINRFYSNYKDSEGLRRNEVSELRGYLAQPVVKQKIEAAGMSAFEVPSSEIG